MALGISSVSISTTLIVVTPEFDEMVRPEVSLLRDRVSPIIVVSRYMKKYFWIFPLISAFWYQKTYSEVGTIGLQWHLHFFQNLIFKILSNARDTSTLTLSPSKTKNSYIGSSLFSHAWPSSLASIGIGTCKNRLSNISSTITEMEELIECPIPNWSRNYLMKFIFQSLAFKM